MRAENKQREERSLEPHIVVVRGQRVIVDFAVKRNVSRFPDDFAFQLTADQAENLKSQSVTSTKNHHANHGEGPMWSQSVTTSQARRRKDLLAWVFTEHGALMAANVLRSSQAVQMSIFVTRAFVRLRENAAANAAILKRLAEIDRTLLQHDAALRDVYRRLLPLLAPPPEPTKRRIGF